jgi:hypothetical protein
MSPQRLRTESLNAFRPRARRCRPRGDILIRLFRYAPVDFDRAFEARAVFDHDLRRRQIPDDRTVLLDLHPSLCAHVSFHGAVHHHVARVDVRREALGVLREEVISYPSGYGYQISCALDPEELAGLGGELLDKYQGKIDWVLGEFGNYSAADLELASTLVYADREALAAEEEISIAELSRRVQEVKPRFSNDQILRQAESLKRRNLLSPVV